ncbi:hypothetical protein NLJ89_g9088 [Agrocybe chaxingu]|uniref:Uncharacterized protein n=1 Tax=Agrocybe chaxingu TaxID=84603 RepID=A0A9W8K0M2_9AGAR|nr:hypothetical protein NLJ89_g9088 [Agrocybe chaxingu]
MSVQTSTPISKSIGRCNNGTGTVARSTTHAQKVGALAEKENNQGVVPQSRPVPVSPLGQREANQQPGAAVAAGNDPMAVFGAIMERVKQIEEELERERVAKKHLEDQVQEYMRKENEVDDTEEALEQAKWEKKYEEMQKKMEEDRQLIASLCARYPNTDISDFGPHANDVLETMTTRPKVTAGKDFSIQIAMGLAGSNKKNDKYTAILRSLRDLVLQSRINWELPWTEIPAGEKAKLFQVARERHPVLKRYMNDWATEEIVKRYMKNKRSHHYSSGWLDVPEKYKYLKDNSSKRDPNGSRVKRAKAELAAKKSRKAARAAEKRSWDDEVEEETQEAEGGRHEEDDVEME